MKKRFSLHIQSLDLIFHFIDTFVTRSDIKKDIHFQINLVIEELFTNMIKYNQKSGGEVEINLDIKDKKLIISLTDFDAPPFDMTKVKPYDTRQKIEKRPIGKVGLHLIKEMMDQIDYQYQNNNNIITLIKHMEKSRV
jgi:anti-sigma regulatory factor (Ser/Thr protein kinase)